MNFQRVTDLFAPDGHVIPAFLFSPDSPRGGALVCPGYGGTKEHVLALAAAIAEKGLAALAIDPCGHGENMAAIGPGIRDELEAGAALSSSFWSRRSRRHKSWRAFGSHVFPRLHGSNLTGGGGKNLAPRQVGGL